MANTKVPNEFLEDNLVVAGDLTVDSGMLYVDSTNNRVGVGTISPDVTMHIAGTTYIEVENSNAFLNIKGDNSAFSGIYFRDGKI